ncbi:acetyl-CoA carboxylase, carboxyltransferase subunit beta [Streptomyces sp. H10-C2]|uniref:acetyl-CoA carboxylase, carboxyltransferase subunit beta n=1 Tax=unclassified Streptomyces TaxID=2593676 RepID=UPI0024B8E808|nr:MULTISPECIES: acetyl-CoA carboxylase, carboxyltransferase subunit beta [unclassified Streptomyces]MDJ0345174.1 acetyl-CoA carboxylase, carboxyltransferase subunit beta [Streptomyces sp. PH10-H1]MDJ0374142.1 acetyl-CoA carboxylase, carboxyltransferase subunit beta [Streptomyces sp. H10-C2]
MLDVENAQPGEAPAWVHCGDCVALIYTKRFSRALQVCPDCGSHARFTAQQRLDHLLDPGSAELLPHVECVSDPLDFVDTRPYLERLRDARAVTGMREAVLCARGTIEGRPVVVAAMDFRFLGGSLGSGVGAQITEAARTSLRLRIPLLLVTASGGARMQEGVLSLMQMAKTAHALAELDEAGILVLSLITDPTYGGVAASFATLADVIIAEPGARLGFAGPRVIEQTTGESLPEGFQTAEFLLAHGLIDDVVRRAAQRSAIAQLLSLQSPTPAAPAASGTPPRAGRILRRAEELPRTDSWSAVRLARHPDRPTTLDYAVHLLDGFHELHGDRIAEDCAAVVGGPGRLSGRLVMLIGHQKGGNDLAERQRRKFGMPSPGGYRKAARLMRLAAKLGLPVVTLIDTPGANPGPEAERNGQAVAIAENLRLMARLPVPIIAVVTGEGGSGGALALAVADRVLVSANGVYSVISPEGCAAILWKDVKAAPAAAAALRVGARDLLGLGIVDGVVPEPPGGAHTDPAQAAVLLGDALAAALDELDGWEPQRLLEERGSRFHRFGLEHDPRAERGAL